MFIINITDDYIITREKQVYSYSRLICIFASKNLQSNKLYSPLPVCYMCNKYFCSWWSLTIIIMITIGIITKKEHLFSSVIILLLL